MVEADEGTAEGEERLMDLRPPLIPDRQSPVPAEPRQRPFDHPAMPPEALARLNPLAGNPDFDPAPVQELATAGTVVRLVGMQFDRRRLQDARLRH